MVALGTGRAPRFAQSHRITENVCSHSPVHQKNSSVSKGLPHHGRQLGGFITQFSQIGDVHCHVPLIDAPLRFC